jgi:hypothetical protein
MAAGTSGAAPGGGMASMTMISDSASGLSARNARRAAFSSAQVFAPAS